MVASSAEIHARFVAGETVFSEGDTGDRAYLIESGRVAVLKGGRTIATLQDGQLFGELALVDDQPRMATIVAETDVTALVIGRENLQERLHSADPVTGGLLRILVNNIRKLSP